MSFLPVVILGATILFMYISLSLSLNLEFGYTGIPNFGKVLFVAAGGMLSASLVYRLMLYMYHLHSNDIFEASPTFANRLNAKLVGAPLLSAELLVLTLAIGGAVGAALGYLASYPAIRLREDSLGMLLLGAGELFAVVTAYWVPIVGGPEYLTVPNFLAGFGDNAQYVILILFAALAVAIFIYSERMARSPLGRTLKAVRDNEVASEALGKDNINIRRKMLIASSFLSGVIGALWVVYWSQIGALVGGDVGGTFPRLIFTFYPFTIVILGGIASNVGVVVGSVVLTSVYIGTTSILPSLVETVNIPGVNVNLLTDFINSLQFIIVGLILIVVLLIRPEGLLHEKPSYPLAKSRLREMAERAKSQPVQPEEQGPEPVKP